MAPTHESRPVNLAELRPVTVSTKGRKWTRGTAESKGTAAPFWYNSVRETVSRNPENLTEQERMVDHASVLESLGIHSFDGSTVSSQWERIETVLWSSVGKTDAFDRWRPGKMVKQLGFSGDLQPEEIWTLEHGTQEERQELRVNLSVYGLLNLIDGTEHNFRVTETGDMEIKTAEGWEMLPPEDYHGIDEADPVGSMRELIGRLDDAEADIWDARDMLRELTTETDEGTRIDADHFNLIPTRRAMSNVELTHTEARQEAVYEHQPQPMDTLGEDFFSANDYGLNELAGFNRYQDPREDDPDAGLQLPRTDKAAPVDADLTSLFLAYQEEQEAPEKLSVHFSELVQPHDSRRDDETDETVEIRKGRL